MSQRKSISANVRRLAGTIVILAALAWGSGGYRAVDMGQLKGGSAVAHAINTGGQVVGESGDPHGGTTHAFFWSQSTHMIDLGTLPGGDYSVARAINAAGQVVGSSNNADHVRAFLWTAGGGMKDLGTLPGDDSAEAWAINTSGQVAGYSAGPNGSRAVVWNGSEVKDLGTLPGDTASQAFAINDQGEVVGTSSGADGATHAFVWSAAGGMQPISTSGNATALLLNNPGMAVGFVDASGGTQAFVWDKTDGVTMLGTLPGGDYSQANAVNNNGAVVGASGSSLGTHAFIWTRDSGMQDLNSLLQGSGIVLSGAVAINDAGMIVAYGAPHANTSQVMLLDHTSHAGALHVYLLIPN